ncbi:MAG: 50S ribosomal protein L3 N(5)-glutamine methyltransferase [Burkholderiales bacterium]|nr:50S ribosomal protein L3 N(5)-glutamine methyltransferase [Burkholderiales bacterium]MDR4518098.1 50S ribosomal protein L3 N(5)-glutamine methyltransferase [Nitrosomonas sp.]
MFTQDKTQLYTIRDLLRFAVSSFNRAGLFFGHGSATAYDEAAYLILHALHLPLEQLEPFLDARLTSDEFDQVWAILERRITEKKPAAYLTHEAWLADYSFYVDERVLIPRSFIAEHLQNQLEPWIADPGEIHTALDLCTGSGCLAILIALAFEHAEVDAVDISDDALAVAERNIADYQLQQQVHLIQSDLFGGLSGKRYDLIISNPPYVNAQSMVSLPEEYRHEPINALASGVDGLDATRRILADAANYLTDQGLLIVEIGHNKEVLMEAFPRLPFTWLETSAGDGFVFLLNCDQLED